jgi:hypothetical protein
MSVTAPPLPLLARITAVLLAVCFPLVTRADLIISEFMAANTKVLADEDGAFSDWIELHNTGEAEVNVAGWYLTDSASNRTKWQFPAVTIPAGGYLLVFASSKDRSDPAGPLHTNFALSASGEYLGLIQADGTTIVSEFRPTFPAQTDNISYGRVLLPDGRIETGFLRAPTPNAANGDGGSLSVVETVAVSRPSGVYSEPFLLELSGASAGQVIRYVAASGPGAADATVDAESPIYTEPIEISSTTLVRAAVFSAEGLTRGVVTSAHYLKMASQLKAFTSKLPVLVLDDLGAGPLEKDGIDHTAFAFGFGGRETPAALAGRSPELVSPLLITVRGSSSAEFPKKGYNVKLRDALGGKRAIPMFDLPAYERWALVAPWAFDQNYINNSLVYELSNRLGRWAPRTRLTEVFFNTGGDDLDSADYAGIYVLTDRIRIEKGRVDIAELSASDVSAPAVTGGYILKIDPPDADELSWRSDRGVPAAADTAIVLVAPDSGDIAPAQLEYIQSYVRRMENALHADRASGWAQRTYLDYIDRPSWIDHHILNVIASNPDGLHRSAYFTKPRGGKLQAGPVWDFDRALGAYWDDRTSVIDTWSGVGGESDFWRTGWWGILAEDPDFVQEWVDRWQSLRVTHLATPALATLTENLAKSVGDAAERDAARWPDNASVYGSYAAQISVLKDWLGQRAGWIDAQFVGRPTAVTAGGIVTFTAPEGAQLIYTLDGTDPRLIGGGIAPNAVVTSEPLSVSASANIRVRSYVPGMEGGIPSAPWSSMIGSTGAGIIAGHSRLVNLSGRAIAGADAQSMVIGLGVADTESKRFLARAIGPGLEAFGTANALGEPRLRVLAASGIELQTNVGWQTSPDAAQLKEAATSVGAFQLGDESADSAVIATLLNGTYSIEIASNNSQTGVVLAELFELETSGRMTNLSIRGNVGSGNPLIAGFVVQGTARKRFLIRAIGPALAELGMSEVLADPVLTLYSGTAVIATNDHWSAADNAAVIEAARKTVGAFPLREESEDAALFVTLPPGAYTLELRGKDDATGTALLEIHGIP